MSFFFPLLATQRLCVREEVGENIPPMWCWGTGGYYKWVLTQTQESFPWDKSQWSFCKAQGHMNLETTTSIFSPNMYNQEPPQAMLKGETFIFPFRFSLLCIKFEWSNRSHSLLSLKYSSETPAPRDRQSVLQSWLKTLGYVFTIKGKTTQSRQIMLILWEQELVYLGENLVTILGRECCHQDKKGLRSVFVKA